MPVLTTVAVQTKPAEIERELLTDIANEANVSDWHDLRWFAVGGDKPRAVIVMLRGGIKKRVATISPTKTPDLWESWKPVLIELQTERAKTNKRRVSHKKLQTGKL